MAKASKKTTKTKEETLVIKPPNFKQASWKIRGITNLVINAFDEKSREQIRKIQEGGQAAKNIRKREPKDFDAQFRNAHHVSTEGWNGFSALGVRHALVDACRLTGAVMTRAKMAIVEIVPDGCDKDGWDLIRIIKGEPKYFECYVRNETGVVDLRARPRWDPGWEATIGLVWDGDEFRLQDITNLLMRAGLQVGIGEGRPFSKKSVGCNWGRFEVIGARAPIEEVK